MSVRTQFVDNSNHKVTVRKNKQNIKSRVKKSSTIFVNQVLLNGMSKIFLTPNSFK